MSKQPIKFMGGACNSSHISHAHSRDHHILHVASN